MTSESNKKLAISMTALSHERRVLVFDTLLQSPENGRCLGALETATGIPRPSLIHHLRVMESAGIVGRTQKGAETAYWLDLKLFSDTLQNLVIKTRQRHPAQMHLAQNRPPRHAVSIHG